MIVMAHIDLYLDNPHHASSSYPFSSIDTSVNADSDARCGQGFKEKKEEMWPKYVMLKAAWVSLILSDVRLDKHITLLCYCGTQVMQRKIGFFRRLRK